ncbi:MAG: hypothetical protein D3923_17815, partial [Candidatus Electrothrix sp. AR3]|nr:hypothetical protein [Candidatus Electrothrix sp. AR3]
LLRLICSQLDEAFAEKIIAHLTNKVDMEAWDGEIPPPELVLAVWCLSEVKNIHKIEEKTGGNLLLKTIACFLQGGSGYRANEIEFIDFTDGISSATESVGSKWPGKSRFDFHGQRPENDFSTYQDKWPFFIAAVFQKRQWIEQSIQQNSNIIRFISLQTLAKYWPDKKTRQLIIQHIFFVQEYSWIYRSHIAARAMDLLAKHWPDDATRQLITERALEDGRRYLCCWAVELLNQHWPDDETQQLIKKQRLVNGAAASLYGKKHSLFGQFVFYNSPTIQVFGYNEPHQPIPLKHIQEVAKRAHVPSDKIDETVRSISEHMGWDITKGSRSE